MYAFFLVIPKRMRIFAAMNYFCKFWLSVVAALTITGCLWAKGDVVPQVHRDIHRVLQEQQNIAQFFFSMTDSVAAVEGEQPFDLYPALDLYSEWNDNFDPMNGKRPANVPNQVDIDLSGWYAPIKGQITSPFGWRKRRMHKGVDIKLYVGDTVRAAFDGRVRICRFERRGYGNYYVIRHENGLETIYGHLSKHIVKADQYVKAGQAIGLGGSTGRSTGPHLHFEMRHMGVALDPSDIINFETFRPHEQIYSLNRKQAEWAQSNKGKRGTRYSDNSSSRNNAKGGKAQAGRANNNNAGGKGYHTIKRGDTLGSIARRYGTTVNRLCKLNGIRANSKIQAGKRLRYK